MMACTVTTLNSSGTKSESGAKVSASSAAKKSTAKKHASRRPSSRRGKEHADPPPSDQDDSDSNSSDSSGDDSSSSDYISSSSDDFDLDLTTSTTTQEGTTVWTYRQYINHNAVEKFNEAASVEDRVGWWERSFDMAAQGSWPDKMKIRQLRGRMSSSLRDWYAKLPKSTRHNWKKLSRRFKVMLNAAAVKAGIEFQKSSKHRERHLRRVIKKLKDTQLKTALQGQMFKSLSEVEHALRRHEDIWREVGYETPPPRRDFRADNDPQGRFKARRPGRAFVAQGSEPDSSSESERRVSVPEPAPAGTQSVFKVENVTKEIYRVLDAEGWRPPPQFRNADVRSGNPDLRSGPMSPRLGNSPWQISCENCGRIGHSKGNCWADLICDHCHQQGHPTEACRANPSPGCNKLHRGFSCEDWRAIQSPDSDTPVEFRLQPGERYGWWEDHEPEDAHEVAMVHGAVNDCQTKILLDTGASVSMLSFDFARELKLKLRMHKQTKVSGLGGVPTYISVHAEIKITLDPRVVYIFRLWVANIGEGVDVLLGMNFMFSAGVRLSTREGLVQLPDEETILMYGGHDRSRMGLDIPREVVWAGRGDRWVTKIIYASKSWPTTVKVVNISHKLIWIDTNTDIARIVDLNPAESRTRDVGVQTESSRAEETCVQDANVDTQGLRHVASAVIAAKPAWDDASFERRFPEMDGRPETLNAGLDENAASDFFSQGFASMPVRRLEAEYASAMHVSAEEFDLEPAVDVREGSELMAQLRDQLAMLPGLQDLSAECNIDEADVGEPGVLTPEMEMKPREILEYHRKIFLGDGNAAPAPARGVVCDLDVENVRPVALRARPIAPHLLIKVYELLKKLLETGLMEHSESEWASPIVVVLKKNEVDIRMCIDYRVVNDLSSCRGTRFP
ncbi:unnamed protein product [Phytophthora fragariaefolia]|uniref:Unnamed protein product n=1 Tax=Phytophthora fragariaefolia TaxID=1490495 RepID=A0A9W7D5R6_9STRA|nr:unnamed protein product [Phytophthora fragariaefolia]